MWHAVCDALLPVALRDISDVLVSFVRHIRRANERGTRPRQLDVIRNTMGADATPARVGFG